MLLASLIALVSFLALGPAPAMAQGTPCPFGALTLSGGPSPSQPIGVDDDLEVRLNETTIFNDTNLESNQHPPIGFTANAGDQLRVIVRNNLGFGPGSGRDALYLHCNATGEYHALAPAVYRNDAGHGESYNETFTINFFVPQCSDRNDNDGDTRTDHGSDPGCDSQTDNSEVDAATSPDGPGGPRLSLTAVSINPGCMAPPGTQRAGAAADLTIQYTLNAPARMTFTLQRRVFPQPALLTRCPRLRRPQPGARFEDLGSFQTEGKEGQNHADVGADGKVVGRTATSRRRAGRRARAPRRRVAIRRLRRIVHNARGVQRVRLSQLLGGQRLAPGAYRLVIEGVSRTNGSWAGFAVVKFRVLKP